MKQRKCPLGLPTGQSGEGIFSFKGPSYWMTVGFVKLTENYPEQIRVGELLDSGSRPS